MYREDEFNDSNRTSRLLQAERYAMSEIQTLDVRIPAEIIHNWGWFLAFGISLALLGILAIVRAVAATVVSMLFFGWLLVIAAGIEIVQAIMVGKWAGRDFPAGLGLAHSQWSHHVVARHPRPGAMAGLGAVGHRPIRRNRIGLLRHRLDRAGARPALVGLVRVSIQIRPSLGCANSALALRQFVRHSF